MMEISTNEVYLRPSSTLATLFQPYGSRDHAQGVSISPVTTYLREDEKVQAAFPYDRFILSPGPSLLINNVLILPFAKPRLFTSVPSSGHFITAYTASGIL